MPSPKFEFQDFIMCRGETVKSLEKKYGIVPSDNEENIRIRIGKKFYMYSEEDVQKVLSIWRDAGKEFSTKDHPTTNDIHRYKILWGSLKKACGRQ